MMTWYLGGRSHNERRSTLENPSVKQRLYWFLSTDLCTLRTVRVQGSSAPESLTM